MKRFFGKLTFIHRRLWQRNELYRVALFFGPAPLIGCLLASAVWGSVQAFGEVMYRPPSWAVPQGPKHWNITGQVQNVQPAGPLPAADGNGALTGYVTGWRVTTDLIQVNAALDVDLIPMPHTSFFLSGSDINMAQITTAGAMNSLYVGVGSGFLAIRNTGVYMLSARFTRRGGPAADCLIRLAFGPRRIISNQCDRRRLKDVRRRSV